MKSKKYPLSRKDNLVVQQIPGELMIYDLENNKAFCLNETSSIVWNLCDGNKSIPQISLELSKILSQKVNDDLTWFALEQLKKENLVSFESDTPAELLGKSRREIIKTIGLGTMIAMPIIASLVAPSAVQAAQSACISDPTCTCLFSNAPANGDSCGNGDMNTCNMGCTCTRNTGIAGCAVVAAMVVCPGVCS